MIRMLGSNNSEEQFEGLFIVMYKSIKEEKSNGEIVKQFMYF